MTRAEWLVYYREKRINARERQTVALSTGNMSLILRELYEEIYTPEQEALKGLFSRYKDKLSPESRQSKSDLIESWVPAAKDRAKWVLKESVCSRNPLFDLISKSDYLGFAIPAEFPKE